MIRAARTPRVTALDVVDAPATKITVGGVGDCDADNERDRDADATWLGDCDCDGVEELDAVATCELVTVSVGLCDRVWLAVEVSV